MAEPLPPLTAPERLDLYHALVLAVETERALPPLLRDLGRPDDLDPVHHHAAAVGSASTLRRASDSTGDLVGVSAGFMGAIFPMGASPLEFFRQGLGRAAARGGGRAPRLQWSDFGRGILGPIHPPGTGLEVLAGVTLAFRMRGEDRVALVCSERGASETGAWHEGLNFAAVRRCPLVVLSVPPGAASDRPSGSRLTSLLDTCDGYGIGGEAVDGEDVFAIREAVARAVARAREGGGVQLVEIRIGLPGRAGGDPVPEWRERFRARGCDRGELHECEARARSEVDEAVAEVLREPEPAPYEALGRIRTDGVPSAPWTRPVPGDGASPGAPRASGTDPAHLPPHRAAST